jgi:hypothetical protein
MSGKQVSARSWLQKEFLGRDEKALLADRAGFVDTSG